MDLVSKECASQTAALVASVLLFVASEAIGLYKGTSRTGVVDIVIGVLGKLKGSERTRPGTPPPLVSSASPVSPAPPASLESPAVTVAV